MKKTFALLLLFIVANSLTYGGGYQVLLQGNKQTAMGLVGTGITLGSESIFYNPGALPFLRDKYSFSLGASGIMSNVVFQKEAPSVYEAETDNPFGTPFYIYGAGKISDKLSIGIGAYTPFGSSTDWGESWAGRFLIQDISLFAVYIQPTVAYQINDQLGIGIGFIYAMGDVTLNKALPLTGSDGSEAGVNMEGSTANYGFNAGITYRPTDQLEFGLTYRSEILMEMEGGDANFTVPQSLAASFPAENEFDAELPLPATINFGASYKASEQLTLALDINFTQWSTYDSLIFDFKTNTPSLQDSRNPRLYDDNLVFRVGGRYKANDQWIVAAGAYYDMPAVKDNYYNPETPDAHKLGLSAGFTYSPSENFDVDASILYIMGFERDATYEPGKFGGTYKYNAVVPGLGINYHF
ncbi:MAG: outer membrane protein transport protein [Bacteroidales bacterium]|nr:outer membrane protein transport protein [Bacteroidales bacterium]